jgi:hypothetical protein
MERERVSLTRRKSKQKKKDKPEPIDGGWCLSCDVRLIPSISIPRGSTLKTLLTALHAIEQTRRE